MRLSGYAGICFAFTAPSDPVLPLKKRDISIIYELFPIHNDWST